MKKIVMTIMLILLGFGLSSCISEITYDDLLLTYQEDVESRLEIYETYMELYQHLSEEIVQSIVKVTMTTTFPRSTYLGSGFVFYESPTSYYVLTNHHVVQDYMNERTFIVVTDYLTNDREAIVIAADPAYDLAVLEIPKGLVALEVLPFSNILLNTKDKVYVMGYPNGQINGITLGEFIDYNEVIISESTDEGGVDFPILMIDSPVETGSSGSVVLNERYEVVGIIYAGNFLEGSISSNYAFAVPFEKIAEFLDLYDISIKDEEST
jgi:serine protease Do